MLTFSQRECKLKDTMSFPHVISGNPQKIKFWGCTGFDGVRMVREKHIVLFALHVNKAEKQ